MSAIVQQDDVSDSAKDDENSVSTAAISDNPGNTSGDTPSTNFDNNLSPIVLNTVEQQSSTIDTIAELLKLKSPEKLSIGKSEEKLPDEIDKCASDSKLITLSSISLSETSNSEIVQKDLIQTESAAKDSLDNTQSIAHVTDSQADNKNFDAPMTEVKSGYKETVIDDASDSEFELRWSDDENDDEINAVPLSDEALKKLDMELGIGDANITENAKEDTQKIITVTAISSLEIEKPKEIVDGNNLETITFAQNSIEMEKPKEIVDYNSSKTDNVVTTIGQCLKKIENPIETAECNKSETVETEPDAVLNLEQELGIDDDGKADLNLDQELGINHDDDSDKADKTNDELIKEIKQLISTNDEESHPIKKQINFEPANSIVTEVEKPTDVDILSGNDLSLPDSNMLLSNNTESGQSFNNKKSNLVNEMDVDEVEKISEIDIDETIVDLKRLIDQDEDTIKQLGIDGAKTSDKNEQKSKTIEVMKKSTEVEPESVTADSELVKLVPESTKIDSDTTNKSVKHINLPPKDEDIPSKIENITDATVTETSLGTDLSDNPSVRKAATTESISMAECKNYIKTSNDQDKDVNISGNVSKMTTAEDLESGDNTVSKGPNSDSVKEKYITKDILKLPEGKDDIQHQVTIEEYDKDKIENQRTQINKDDSKNYNNTTPEVLTDLKLVERDDSLENDLTKQTETVVNKNVDYSNIPERSCEPNLDETAVNISEVAVKDVLKLDSEEFITPDLTNDSIKINTDHRINRPDVMLHIPTQEFDFDDFDETSQAQSGKTDEKESDLTTKTVTEIVNLLAKETENMDSFIIKNVDVNSSATTLDNKINENDIMKTKQAELQSKITTTNDVEMTSIENGSNITEKVKAETKKSDKIDDTTCTKNYNKSLEEDLKLTENVDKSSQKDDESSENHSKSTENYEKLETFDTQPSTSTESTKDTPDNISITPQENDKTSDGGLKSTEKVQKPENIDPQPSTSEGITEEAQEVTDSLGLLAESSRVMDDDEDEEQEPEDDEADEGDDDDDFDPDDEESSNPTGEHSEESNPPHSEVDIQDDGIDIEFNNEVDKITLESNDASFDTLLGDLTDTKDDKSESTETAKETQKETEPKGVDSTGKSSESSADGTEVKDSPSSILADLLTKPAADMNILTPQDVTKTLGRLKRKISKTDDVSIVDLGGSSSEDDVQLNKDSKEEAPSVTQKAQLDDKTETTLNIDGEPDLLNYEAAKEITKDDMDKSKTGEVFSLDSDDDDKIGDNRDVSFIGTPRENNKCINFNCVSDDSVEYYLADRMTIAYYGAALRRKRAVCQNCLNVVDARNEGLVSGIKDLRPLMGLRMARPTQTLLEISDSDSEGEDETVGEDGARFLEDKLTDMINEVWLNYKMDDRLKETESYLEAELDKMQKESEEVDKLLRDCQKATDELRVEFYTSFEGPRHQLPGISIYDTPIASYACLETEEEFTEGSQLPLRYPKRRSTTTIDTPAKKQALPCDGRKMTRAICMAAEQSKLEEDKDISVVRLSAETAPADLPPTGELVKPQIKMGAQVYAMKNQYGAWLKGKVLEIQPKQNEAQFTMCRIRFDHKVKNPCKMLSARSIAYTEPSEVRLIIGTRVIALFKNTDNSNKRGEFYYSGVVAEIPNPVNGYRYLVFFDDGYAQYVEHKHTRLVYESKTLVWEEVHPFSRDFVCNYLMKYPERPMVRLHPGQEVNVEWNGKWWDTKVITVDAALVQVQFPDSRTEWIYRGSTRLKPLFAELLAAKRGDRARLPRSTKANTKTDVPYVEYTRSDDQAKTEPQSAEDLRRQRSVAKKSTTIAQQISNAATEGLLSRVVYYTPKNSVRPHKMVTHLCGPQCKRSDLLSLKDLRTYNPLTKPLLSGWERQVVRHKSSRGVMYRAPCGRRLRCMRELHRYLRTVRSDMSVDLFDFNPNTHCLAEFVLSKTNVQKKDLSHGKENVPVPCVNYLDHSLPEFCSYNTERTPTAGVPLNLDPEFLCGCDCDDDCQDKSKCACWKMTLEGAKTIGIEGQNIGYNYRRLPEPLPSGIYECNSRCKCKSTCLNRVVQNPLQLKLQIFKTLNRGWGIRALNDVPKGAFICIYAGNLLTDATANLDGLNEGDEYLAELDYIEVVESMKEGYEADVPEADNQLDKKDIKKCESDPESESTESEEEETPDKTDIEDGDFQPGYVGLGLLEFNKRLRRRDKKKIKDEAENKDQTSEDKSVKKEEEEEFITISDDEEVRVSQREPSRFAAQENMTDNKVISKYRSIRSHYGKDEACYIMDAKVQGNIGRYLNHSCSPNVFVQNVFVDTHDPRFPWVSFFALHHIRAGTELTWNYNYDIGSVPGKVLYCYCGAPNCRGRLL